MSKKFKVNYLNKDSEYYGHVFWVREAKKHPEHYLIVGKKKHINGGKLNKVHCFKISYY